MLPIQKTLAIVDDDEVFHFILDKTIRRVAKFRDIFSFSSGKQVLDYLDNCSSPDLFPDVIFLDINMPLLNGWQFLEKYLERKTSYHKEPIIYMMSSSLNPEDIERARNIEVVTRYHSKPVSIEKMKQIVLELA